MSRSHVPSSHVQPTLQVARRPRLEAGDVPASAQPGLWPWEPRPATRRRTLWAFAIAADALISAPAWAGCVISPPGPLDAIPTGATVACVGTDNTTPLLAAPGSRNVTIAIGDGTTPTSLTPTVTPRDPSDPFDVDAAVSVTDSSAVTLRHASLDYALGADSSNPVGIHAAGNGNAITLDTSNITGSGYSTPAGGGISVVGAGNTITMQRSSINDIECQGYCGVRSGVSIVGNGNSGTFSASSIRFGFYVQGDANSIALTSTRVTAPFPALGRFPVPAFELFGDNNRVTLNGTTSEGLFARGNSNAIGVTNSTVSQLFVGGTTNTVTLNGTRETLNKSHFSDR